MINEDPATMLTVSQIEFHFFNASVEQNSHIMSFDVENERRVGHEMAPLFITVKIGQKKCSARTRVFFRAITCLLRDMMKKIFYCLN